MSKKLWFCSDHHFEHKNIIKFTDDKGVIFRPFKDVDHHDETIINNHNELVHPHDTVYFMGDVAINKIGLLKLSRMNGRKILIKGNHDIFDLKYYLPHFEDIRAYKMFPKHGIAVSHIPIYIEERDNTRFKWNVHGHLHANEINKKNYINLCLEKTDFKPVCFEDILEIINNRGE